MLAYGSYMLADAFHLSGVIATVTAAIVLGNVGPGRAMTATGADAIDTVWEFFAYLLTAVVFLLVGLAIPPGRLLESLGPIAWGIAGILIGRAIVVYLLLGGVSRLARRPGLAEPLPRGWLHVLFWAGLRGAVAVAMALSLPADVPQRALLQEITFGVVLFTLLVQGTTVGWVVDRTIGTARDRRHRRPTHRLPTAPAAPPSDGGTALGARSRRRRPPPVGRSCAGSRRSPGGSCGRSGRDRAIRRTRGRVRATSPSDHPAYRPKFRTVPDGRPGGGPAAPKPSAERIDSSYPLPCVERPDVQSRDTVSGWGADLVEDDAPAPAPGVEAGRAAADPPCVSARVGSVPLGCGVGVVLSSSRFRSKAWRFAGSPISSHAALIAAIRLAASEVVARSG